MDKVKLLKLTRQCLKMESLSKYLWVVRIKLRALLQDLWLRMILML